MASAEDPAEPHFDDAEREEQIIREEYRVWRKNAPFLYDCVATNPLEWPSLTCQWLPGREEVAGKDYTKQRMLLGTHTSAGEQNHLLVAEVRVPKLDAEVDPRQFSEESGELGGYGGASVRVDIRMKINHDGEVNRARYMPQNPFVVATKTVSTDVFVFDLTKHPSEPTEPGCRPQHRLAGHKKEGYGLAWAPHVAGRLVSGSDDAQLCMWTVGAGTGPVVDAERLWTGHRDVVEDVDWHCSQPDLFGSVADDHALMIWDVRTNDSQTPAINVPAAHDAEANALSFSPFNEHLVLTAGADRVVRLWDMRNTERAVHTFEGHRDEIFTVHWSPHVESVFGSASADRRVHLWDLSKIGEEQDPEDAEDGPPELLFIHGGHTDKVCEFSWNQEDPWFVASIAEDNLLHIWQLSEAVYNDADDSDAEGGGEEGEGAGAGSGSGSGSAEVADEDLE